MLNSISSEETPASMLSPALLLVANYESGVGYAWWLMESFWCAIAERYAPRERVLLAYPLVTTIPPAIGRAPVQLVTAEFAGSGIATLWSQFSALRRWGVRTIYLTDRPTASLRYLLYRLAGVRWIIVHDHTPGNREAPVGLKRLLKRMLHLVPMIRASGVIGATPFVTARHRTVNMVPSQLCFTATNGLPAAQAIEPVDVHARFGILKERRILVGVGRASPIKGVDTVLAAVAKLVHERGIQNLHYLYLGDGPQLARLRGRADSLGIADWVSLPGHTTEVQSLLAGCDIAVHASQGEVGYSLSILEFMQAGLPVVVSDDPSVSGATLHGETGLHFRTGDAAAAAEAIERLLGDDDARMRMGVRAREVQQQRFRLTDTHQQVLHVFDLVRGDKE